MCRIYFEKNGEKLLQTIGMSKSEFARRMGIKKQNVKVLFKTKNLDTIRKASRVLGVPLALLVSYTEEPCLSSMVHHNIDPKDAFWYLIDIQSGALTDVFHRTDIGNIDIIWGDREGGICHILLKQIENQDFTSLNQMIDCISETIESGIITQESSSEVCLSKDNLTVSLRQVFKEILKPDSLSNWSLMTYWIKN